MRVFQIETDWGIQNLRLGARPDPAPGPGQVLLRMAASSLNYRDLVVLERGYGVHTGTLPLIPLSDGVGTVVEVGAGVTRIAAGQRACPLFFQGWSGGVALFTLQFAKLLGAHVTVISSSASKIERLKQLGADATLDRRVVPEWGKATREITGGRGYDHIVELGGAETLPQSLRCIRPGGTISMIGVLSGSAMTVPLGPIITRQVRLQGVTVGHRDGFEAMLRALARHRVRPIVDRVFAFEELKEALAYLRSGAQFGKVGIAHGGA